jgi:hypothetical protein
MVIDLKIWTIQDYQAFEQLVNTGELVVAEKFIEMLDYWRYAYDWMAEQMRIRIGNPPPCVKYPVWAWYQWEGKRKKPDMRSRHGEPGRRIVRLTLELDKKDMLLSDFDLWHMPLNHGYLSLSEQEDEEFDNEYKKCCYSYHDLKDCSINTPAMKLLREKMTKSWERIFDLTLEPNDWLIEPMEKKSIQTTLWSIRQDQVVKAEVFTAQ